MIYMIQILKMLNNRERKIFVKIFNDLSYEIEEMGYECFEEELVSDLLMNHLGLEIEDNSQLRMFTEYVLKHQGRLESSVRGACLLSGMKFV